MAPDLGLATTPQQQAPPTVGQRVSQGLSNVGLVLGNVAAGMQGRELPTDRLKRERRAQALQNMQILNFGLNFLNQVREQAKTIEPGPARDRFIQQWGEKGDSVLPGISKMIPDVMENDAFLAYTNSQEFLDAHPEARIIAMMGDPERMREFVMSDAFRKSDEDFVNRREIGGVIEKFPRWKKEVQTRFPEIYANMEKDGWTSDEIVTVNQMLSDEGPGISPENSIKMTSLQEKVIQSPYGPSALQSLGINIAGGEAGGVLVRLVAPDGTQITRRRDDPEVDQLIKQGYNLAAPTGTPAEAGLAKPVAAKTEQKIIDLVGALGRFNQIEMSYNPEYLTYTGQIKGEALNKIDKFGWNISPENAEYVAGFKDFQRNVAHEVDALIHEISGAAVSGEEAKRLSRETLDASKLGPTAFKSRMRQIKEEIAYGFARQKWFLENGLKGEPTTVMGLSDMEKYMNDAGAELYQGYIDQGASEDEAEQLALQQIRQQFGFAPGDF